MHRRHFLQLSALGALPASLGLTHSAFAQAKDAIQFGCPVPMSGAFAANGKFAYLGMKLAIEQYGKALDRPLAYTLLKPLEKLPIIRQLPPHKTLRILT